MWAVVDRCVQFLGPDIKETITKTDPGFCGECSRWYSKGR